MTITMERKVNGLWLIVESECAIYHIKVAYDESVGWFAECEDGALLCTKTLKSFWKHRRAIAKHIIEDFM